MNENKKYLNSFTILSFDPNNVYVSFNTETLLLDDKIWKNETPINSNENEEAEIIDITTEPEEYWIIENNGKNEIFIKNSLTEGDFNTYNVKAGPFFSIDNVVLYLNILNDIGF